MNKDISEIPTENIKLMERICDLFFNLLEYKLDLIREYNFKINENFKNKYNEKFLLLFDEYNELYDYYLKNIKQIKYTNLEKLKKHFSNYVESTEISEHKYNNV